MSYRLVFDACNDLSPHYDVQEGVEIVPLAYEIDGKRYLRYQDDRELSVDEFYKLGKDGKYGKTSQVPPSDFQAAARRYLKRGEDVFLMPFSSSPAVFRGPINPLWWPSPPWRRNFLKGRSSASTRWRPPLATRR